MSDVEPAASGAPSGAHTLAPSGGATGGEGVGEAVGRTVRAMRSAHGWSLDRLAARSGVSKGVLVALEQGRGNPNLGTLIRISQALGVALTRLVQVEEEPLVQLFPPKRHVVLWQGPGGGTGTLLGGSDPRPSIELWKWELAPGERRDSEPHTPGTREILYVEEGTLDLTVDGHRHRLPAGIAGVFAGDRSHSYGNEEESACRYVLAVMDL
jgi:transcriptional regulator with XRE-family HTH domain